MTSKNRLIETYILTRGENTGEKSSNLYVNNYGELVNYNTVIAYFTGNVLYINTKYYSHTTSRNQNLLKHYAEKHQNGLDLTIKEYC